MLKGYVTIAILRQQKTADGTGISPTRLSTPDDDGRIPLAPEVQPVAEAHGLPFFGSGFGFESRFWPREIAPQPAKISGCSHSRTAPVLGPKHVSREIP